MINSQIFKKQILTNTAKFVEQELKNAEAGHDWHHIQRVLKNAKRICKTEKCDNFIVELSVLLHDIADHKFHNGDEQKGSRIASDFLNKQGLDQENIDKVTAIVQNISFKGKNNSSYIKTKEFFVAQDADRLDALGAIGIARAFHYGGYKNNKIFDPTIKPNLNMNKHQYINNTNTTINHFYEKIFLLKDLMNTKTGKQLAKRRHEFVKNYIKEFHLEIKGKI